MATVSIADAKSGLSDLVRRAEAGESIAVTRRGKVAARIVAPIVERERFDLARLKAHTDAMPFGTEQIEQFIRRFRDNERF